MAAVSSILVGAALAGTALQVKQARETRKEAKSEAKRMANESSRLQAEQVEKEKVSDVQASQMKKRERMRAMAGRATGRQSTILGGAGDVGNAGNQAQAGAGKTLLGV